ncbi:unknown [Bacteroides sp. CAG:189]|nr:unknown [Bacteroides sp. CAG:189]
MCVFLRVRIEYKKWQRVLSAILKLITIVVK